MTALQKIKIESGIAIPPRKKPRAYGVWTNLAQEMKRGDSVLLNKQQSHNLYQALKKAGFKAPVRMEGNKFRVWKGVKID